jgi:predicted ester cyclase
MTRDEIVDLMARCLSAIDRHDAAALAEEHAETCVMESPTAGGTLTGRAAIAQVYDAWFRGFPDLVATSEDLLVDGDRLAQCFTLSGTDTGGFLGVQPTGKPFRLSMVWLCRVRDGKIVHLRAVYDFSGMLIQIGVLKAKPI